MNTVVGIRQVGIRQTRKDYANSIKSKPDKPSIYEQSTNNKVNRLAVMQANRSSLHNILLKLQHQQLLTMAQPISPQDQEHISFIEKEFYTEKKYEDSFKTQTKKKGFNLKQHLINLFDFITRNFRPIYHTPLPIEHVVAPQSENIFLLNLNHGVVPLKFSASKNKLEIIEYTSLVRQVKIPKAPVGGCPRSNRRVHMELVESLKNIYQLSDSTTHSEILAIIKNESISENNDVTNVDALIPQLMDRLKRGEVEIMLQNNRDKLYREVIIERGTPSINKYFFMDKNELDGDIYFLKTARILLPIPTTIREVHLNELDQGFRFYIAADLEFITSIQINIINPNGSMNSYSPHQRIKVLMNSRIELDQLMIQHITDMGIKSIFVHEHVSNSYNLYPYETGHIITGTGNIIEYNPFTGLFSCPYFINYIRQSIQNTPSVASHVRDYFRDDDNFISICTSLLYPHNHLTVFGLNLEMLSNYFVNAGCLYSYDFTCQDLQLVEVEPNKHKITLDTNISDILFNRPGNQQYLYNNAHGITKKTKKQRNKKRQEKKKKKSQTKKNTK
jgi:hypothetical protein